MEMLFVQEDNIELNIAIPGNDDVQLEKVVTIEGVKIRPQDSFAITSQDGGPFRVIDMEFLMLGADTVIVLFTRPEEENVKREVMLYL